ncbi:MBL fold metallo-hydrolase [Alteromonas sp. W364]|jgi:L-ascorbate metabolism protein UlaG (beta-lactamase superfamily)|uniref:MBL fold metallo-hydrolase n=1 Tax=Alteromonas sp. W364 TaxID=3075610 RepID=UPI002883D187|nr:MBL fold metallo-hydrolase [Alteromonas sp. W364]MDT0629404.1 MBL fold metallo-hydrolase [Alteromonas sp. W364]
MKKYQRIMQLALIFPMLVTSLHAYSHETTTGKHGTAHYLANEGIMVEAGEYKVLFDPFFHNDYGTYQLVPEKILAAIMANEAPYNDIDIVFVSHAHGDHFNADDMLAYLQEHNTVHLVAPSQAIQKLAVLEGFKEIETRIEAIALEYKDKPVSFKVKDIIIDAVRIPHAGWPGRADVSNIVFRVTLPSKEHATTYIHMGDADPNDTHFRPLLSYWQKQETDLAFPPYWFFLSSEGNYILDYRINAKRSVGVHVPLKVPAQLIQTGKPYFSVPGESISVPID